ncbi:MAG: SGNH/GDSL hydrolase family protein [Microbacterium sp.]|uniref:SGNH/GDSL hydrolase family protein n=1 Tax=Microbacterium sp. TaxID=51671 RepID=UPI001ACE90D2|nr:SGNH/GDSL hydrolase family protein [Microbacterium sp.]MBN9155122.1 SGNH/GDSL hydrolase family protein [Microbacterium sp.]
MTRRTIVFAGDSITDAGRREDPDGLGDGYVRIIAERLEESGYRVVNAGISGDRAVDLRARWSEDVQAHEPDVLSVLVGVNDTWRRYDSADATSAEEFRAVYDELLTSMAGTGASIVLMEPFLLPVTDAMHAWRTDDLDDKIAVVRALAEKHGATLIGLDGLLTDAAGERGPEAVASDGVHPTPYGHALIADAWIAAAEPHLA